MEDFNSIKKKLLKSVDFEFFDKAILSNPFKKGNGICFKAVISKTLINGKEGFQISYFIDKKVVHENIVYNESIYDRLIEKLLEVM